MIGKITRQCIKWPREAAANKCRKSLNQRDTEIRDGNNLLDHLARSLRPCAVLLTVSRTLKNPKNAIQGTCKNLLKGRDISQEVIKNLPNLLSARLSALYWVCLGIMFSSIWETGCMREVFGALLTKTQVLLPKIRPPSVSAVFHQIPPTPCPRTAFCTLKTELFWRP